jgi:hypothetical protein
VLVDDLACPIGQRRAVGVKRRDIPDLSTTATTAPGIPFEPSFVASASRVSKCSMLFQVKVRGVCDEIRLLKCCLLRTLNASIFDMCSLAEARGIVITRRHVVYRE